MDAHLRIVSKALALLVASIVVVRAQSPTAAVTVEASLHQTLVLLDHREFARAAALTATIIENPAFPALNASIRHLALATATQISLGNAEPQKAQEFAKAATQMPEGTLDDWRRRLSASGQLTDARDQAVCVTEIARRWGVQSWSIPSATVFQVFYSLKRAETIDAETAMLSTLFERRWHPPIFSASPLWLEYVRLLSAAGQTDLAAQVAAQIDDPADIIVMRADRRYESVLRLASVRSNPKRATLDRIKLLQAQVHAQPQSLATLRELLTEMLHYRMYVDVLSLTQDAEHRMQAAPERYEDLAATRGDIAYEHARALWFLERRDDAAAILHAAIPSVSVPGTQMLSIAWADMLCALDRPDDALAALPNPEKTDAFGQRLAALIRATAWSELGDHGKSDEALNELRQQRLTEPRLLQSALLRTGAFEEGRRLLLERLEDPSERGEALLTLQDYAHSPRTDRQRQWHQAFESLSNDPAVKAMVARVGRIERYPWRLGVYE